MGNVETRALTIAAQIMQAAGLCRYENFSKCRRVYVNDIVCVNCIRSWLISKAKKEIENKTIPKRRTNRAKGNDPALEFGAKIPDGPSNGTKDEKPITWLRIGDRSKTSVYEVGQVPPVPFIP